MRNFAVRHPLILFFLLAYACAWLVAFPMAVFHWPIQMTILATFGPTIAALLTHRLSAGNYRAFRLYTGWWTIAAAFIGIALIIAAYIILPAITTADPRKLHWGALLSLNVYSYSTFLAGPLGEEPGWRGFALPRMEARFGPVLAPVLVGLLWAAWHLPFFFIHGWTSSPPWIYVLIVVSLSFVMTFAFNLSRFAVLTAIAMHAAFNTVSRFLAGLFGNIEPSAPIPFELVLAVCGFAVAALLIAATRGRLAYPPSTAGTPAIGAGV